MELNYSSPLKIEEVKARDGEFEVSGYVSTFGNLDHGGDVVMRGAFDRTLADGHTVRFLYAHDMAQVLGVTKTLKTDDTGLFGTFKISKTTLGEDVHTLLKDGAVDSFSIGYFTRDYEYDDAGVRKLLDVDLLEASVVSVPMNDRALVTRVKADQPFDLLMQQVCDALGIGLTEAKALFARRVADGREPTERHLAAVKALLANAEAAADVLRPLLLPPAPEVKADDAPPLIDSSPMLSDLSLRLATARHRLVLAGILEKAS